MSAMTMPETEAPGCLLQGKGEEVEWGGNNKNFLLRAVNHPDETNAHLQPLTGVSSPTTDTPSFQVNRYFCFVGY